MKISMTPKGDGVSKVMVERDGRVYSFDGHITDFELNYERDDYGYDFAARHLKTQSYTVNVTLSAGAIQVLDKAAMDAEIAKKYGSFPQRYVLGVDQQVEPVAVIPEEPVGVDLQPSDIPADWIEL